MQCPKCHTDTTGFVNYCSVCGYHLTSQQRTNRSLWRIIILLGIIIPAGFIIFFISKTLSDKKTSTKPPLPFFPKSHFNKSYSQLKSDRQTSVRENPQERFRLPQGKTILHDRKGNTLYEYSVVAISGGWIALPVNFVYGAYEWHFISPNGIALPITGGILQDHDQIGLWRIDETLHVNGPELVPWNPELVLEWMALGADTRPVKIQPQILADSGDFIQISLPEHIQKETGCFIQDNQIVGWTFGKELKNGFLWVGNNGIDLIPDFRVDDFYRLTFSQSREEYFLMALSDKSISNAELFTLLTEAFFYETKMPVKAIPKMLSVENIREVLVNTARRLLKSEQYIDIANAADINVISQINSPELTVLAIEALFKAEGSEAAFQLMYQLNRLGPSSWFEAGTTLSKLYRKVFLSRLDAIAETGSTTEAFELLQEARDLFPSDPAIHLASVRLYLNEGQWQIAESLLLSRNYPESYNDTIEALSNRIDELKGLEGKTVIRFVPGSRRIPVYAQLNEQITQQFFIDTGASVSTIPPSAAESMGIDINRLSSKKKYYSPGGEFTAPMISLRSIAIEQLMVHDLMVLVVELPENDDFGLLGMDFLSHFNMNVNSDEGVLILEPK